MIKMLMILIIEESRANPRWSKQEMQLSNHQQWKVSRLLNKIWTRKTRL